MSFFIISFPLLFHHFVCVLHRGILIVPYGLEVKFVLLISCFPYPCQKVLIEHWEKIAEKLCNSYSFSDLAVISINAIGDKLNPAFFVPLHHDPSYSITAGLKVKCRLLMLFDVNNEIAAPIISHIGYYLQNI